VRAAGVDEIVGVREGQRHRFLDDDVLAGLRGLDPELRVRAARRADGHDVNVAVVQQLLERAIGLEFVVVGDLLRPLERDVIDSGKARVRELVDRADVFRRDFSRPDNRKVEHRSFPLYRRVLL